MPPSGTALPPHGRPADGRGLRSSALAVRYDDARARYVPCSFPGGNVMTRVASLTGPGLPPWREEARFSVLIADGDEEFRELVRRHLGPSVIVIGDACDGDEAVWLAKRLRPDV